MTLDFLTLHLCPSRNIPPWLTWRVEKKCMYNNYYITQKELTKSHNKFDDTQGMSDKNNQW